MCQVSACQKGYCAQWHPRFDYIMACAKCDHEDDSGDLCPIETPYRCYTGNCVANITACNPIDLRRGSMPPASCASHEPVRDFNGRCRPVEMLYGQYDQYEAPCPIDKPHKCYGGCYASIDVCSSKVVTVPVSLF
jgi:hypothetical protein